MNRTCGAVISVALLWTLSVSGRGDDFSTGFVRSPAASDVFNTPVSGAETVLVDSLVSPTDETAKFPKAYPVPGTSAWWKFGGYIKGDLIHDFRPAGTVDRFVPTTIPTTGEDGHNTLMQAKATRFNFDIRTPTDWGIARGFVEGDFFTSGANFRLRHAYAEIGPIIAGQTWTAFTNPDGIPRTLDFESPIAFIVQRQAQFRWTESFGEQLKWAVSIENPTTAVDDIVTATIPGQPEQPIPDFVTHLKYTDEYVEWFVAGMLRELVYQPDVGSDQSHLGWGANFVGVIQATDDDKLIGQFVMGNGLGRYRGGSDLGLDGPLSVDSILHIGGCVALTHQWSERLSSTGVYSFAVRRDDAADPPDTHRFASYTAVNLIWEPIDGTTMGVEYLFGTNETKDHASGTAHRLQASVQYNF